MKNILLIINRLTRLIRSCERLVDLIRQTGLLKLSIALLSLILFVLTPATTLELNIYLS